MRSPLGVAPGEDEIDIGKMWDFVVAGKWIVAATVSFALLIGFIYLLGTAPIFRADGLVQVEPSDSKSGAASSASSMSALLEGTPVQTEAEIQVLNSRLVLNQVIDEMNLLISVTPRYFPVFGNAYARRFIGATTPVKPFPGLSQYAWGGETIDVPTLEVPDALAGQALLLQTEASGYSVFDADGNKLLTGNVGEKVVATTASGPITIFVRELNARPRTQFYLSRQSRQAVQDALASNLMVAEKGRQSGVIEITFSGKSPRFVAEVINNLENAYLRQNVERRSAEAAQSLEFLEKQLPELKGRVVNAQASLNAYQLLHGAVDVTKETEIVLQQSVSLESERLQLQQQRQQAVQRFTPEHPAIKTLDTQIQAIEAEQAKQKAEEQKLPTTQQDILGLVRDLDVANQLYIQMLNSIQQLQVAKAGTVGNVRIIDYAIEPLRRYSPKRTAVMVLSLVLGLVLGTAGIMVQVALVRGVDDPNVLESKLGISCYAMIPFSSSQRRIADKLDKAESGDILALTDGKDLAIEAIRSLRNSLNFLMLESQNNVVMLTGPTPGLGKSFISINLGAVIALSGKRVVVVDADMRRGHLQRYINAPIAPGISDFVASGAAYEDIVRPTKIDGLMLITCGTTPPNPAELLTHERFALLIQKVSKEFDYVLIDTPPVLPVVDAAIVSRLAGCTLLLIKSAETRLREVEESYKRLQQGGASIRGAVFNQVGKRMGAYGYGLVGSSYDRYQRYD